MFHFESEIPTVKNWSKKNWQNILTSGAFKTVSGMSHESLFRI